MTGLNSIEAEKPSAHTLLAALEYKDSKRYADFNASTDHIAEYGLAALIGGLARSFGQLGDGGADGEEAVLIRPIEHLGP